MPAIAMLLSLLLLVPFIVFALGAVGDIPQTAERMLIALIDYASLILAFGGGVHWGLALSPDVERPGLRFGAGMLPLVVAWIGLVVAQLLAPSVALAMLIVGYLATVLTEHRAARSQFVPQRYVLWRWGFSIIAMAMMMLVLILRSTGQTIVF